MRLDWDGWYLDGETAARRRARLTLGPGGLEIAPADAATCAWPYAEIEQRQGHYAGEQVRLERRGGAGAAVLVDHEFVAALRRVAPADAARFHDPAVRSRRIALTVLAAVASLGMAAAGYVWVIPGFAAVAADHVPVRWEERLGASVTQDYASSRRECADPIRRQPLEELLAAVTAPIEGAAYRFRLTVVDDKTVNAFAAPGGYIIVLRGLLDETDTPEQLAGVLAHEVQHVLHRHTTRLLFEQTSTGLLMSLMAGDPGGTVAFAPQAARVLGLLRYSRTHEEEADVDGLRLLQTGGIDPRGMAEFFEKVQKRVGTEPSLFQYVSTHPKTAQRIERLRELAAGGTRARRVLLPLVDWRRAREVCTVGR